MKHWNLSVQKKFIQEKLNEVENVNVDFAGQTIFEKLDEGVQYFVNPLRNEDEDELQNIKALNSKLEKLKSERKRLNDVSRNLMLRNKARLEEIRSLREEIEEL